MVPAPIRIGRKVWLGAAVTIVPGVTIGAGAIVGADPCAASCTRPPRTGTGSRIRTNCRRRQAVE